LIENPTHVGWLLIRSDAKDAIRSSFEPPVQPPWWMKMTAGRGDEEVRAL
jgi:hypothetical protein